MFLDASAIIAVLTNEEGADRLVTVLARGPARFTSALAVWEAVVGLARKKQPMPFSDARAAVQRFLSAAEVRLIPIGAMEKDWALDAFERYGKGRHPARLNMADCFAYACARSLEVPLLYKGDDFSKTDIPAA